MSTEAKRYYWIKLKENFFDLETIDWLISQKNGCEYIVLYQKLCLLTANKGGRLAMNIGEMIVPFDINKISRDTKFDIDTVIVAMELFRKIGLIYEEEDGILKIPYVSEMVGSETSHALKKRKQRERKRLQIGDIEEDNEGDNVRQEKEIEKREKILEIQDIEGEEKQSVASPDYNNEDDILKPIKGNLMLSENQIGDLLDKMGLEAFDEYLLRLSEYVKKTGFVVKSHYKTILKWYNEDRGITE